MVKSLCIPLVALGNRPYMIIPSSEVLTIAHVCSSKGSWLHLASSQSAVPATSSSLVIVGS